MSCVNVQEKKKKKGDQGHRERWEWSLLQVKKEFQDADVISNLRSMLGQEVDLLNRVNTEHRVRRFIVVVCFI